MTTLQPGQMLGQYQITSQIGKGGMATVYKAYQASMDRYVALKVVSGQVMDDPNFLKRFRQEARLIAKLEHPHILPVHDFGEADGTPYMVMRFLEAGTLTERLEMGQLALPEIDHILSQLTDALGYAHENGVIHRDIKPSNAMLDKRGDVFLTDFGIAKMIEGSAGMTATGAITGTPSYMSPEQAQGNKLDQRSDIYSLGVVLFEMLTGRVPFEAETPMAVLFKQILDPPPPLSTVRPDLPYTLEIVLLKAMAKKPEDRYSSMGAFRTSWKNALADADAAARAAATQQPAQAANVPPAVPVTPPVVEAVPQNAPVKKGRNWTLVAIGIFAGLVVCAGLALVLVGPALFALQRAQVDPTATVEAVSSAVPFNDKPAANPSAIPAKGATSWTAGNSVFSIAFRDDEVLASGFGGVTVWEPDGSHKQITTADGLPSGNMGAVFVDTDDSLWVGSDAGVTHVHADKSVTTYTTEQGLDANYVVLIGLSGDRLLAGTQYSGAIGGGLLQFNGNSWKQVPGFPSSDKPDAKLVSYNVRGIATDQAGDLWVATESGVAMLDGANKWHVFKIETGLADNDVYTVYVNQAGNVFAGTANGSVAQYNFDRKVFENFIDLKAMGIDAVCCILMEKNGNQWFAGGNNVLRYNASTQDWTTFTADKGTFPFYSVHSMAINSQGTLYFGSDESGLVRYANGKFEKLQVAATLRYGQYGRIVAAPDGKLNFVQLYENGVDQFDPVEQSWSRVSADLRVPRAFDAQGQMWSGGSDGLWVFGTEKTTHITTELGLPSNRVSSIAFNPDGTALIATDAGIALFDGSKVLDVYTAAKDHLASDDVYVLFVASDGSLWASVNGGFSRRLQDGTWQHFTSETLFGGSSGYFYSFVEDREGTIWITSFGDGLYSFKKDKWKRMLSTDPGVDLPSNALTGMALAPDGALWIGTYGQGAVRYDGKTWKRYGLEEGLLQLNVNWIYAEPDAIWLTTNGGITRLVP